MEKLPDVREPLTTIQSRIAHLARSRKKRGELTRDDDVLIPWKEVDAIIRREIAMQATFRWHEGQPGYPS